tara:strand:+ start:695 stop:883 length:189 start_codon:yes stop_codon:yes gene_type:complete
MSKLESTIKMINNTLDLITEGKELDKKLMSGEITVEEYKKLNKKLNQWHETEWKNFKKSEDN